MNDLGSDAECFSGFSGAMALSHEGISGLPAKNLDQHVATSGAVFDSDESFHEHVGEGDGGGPAGIRTRVGGMKTHYDGPSYTTRATACPQTTR